MLIKNFTNKGHLHLPYLICILCDCWRYHQLWSCRMKNLIVRMFSYNLNVVRCIVAMFAFFYSWHKNWFCSGVFVVSWCCCQSSNYSQVFFLLLCVVFYCSTRITVNFPWVYIVVRCMRRSCWTSYSELATRLNVVSCLSLACGYWASLGSLWGCVWNESAISIWLAGWHDGFECASDDLVVVKFLCIIFIITVLYMYAHVCFRRRNVCNTKFEKFYDLNMVLS